MHTLHTLHTHIHTNKHYITLHYITLHYITLHYITLHYIHSIHTHACIHALMPTCMHACTYVLYCIALCCIMVYLVVFVCICIVIVLYCIVRYATVSVVWYGLYSTKSGVQHLEAQYQAPTRSILCWLPFRRLVRRVIWQDHWRRMSTGFPIFALNTKVNSP